MCFAGRYYRRWGNCRTGSVLTVMYQLILLWRAILPILSDIYDFDSESWVEV